MTDISIRTWSYNNPFMYHPSLTIAIPTLVGHLNLIYGIECLSSRLAYSNYLFSGDTYPSFNKFLSSQCFSCKLLRQHHCVIFGPKDKQAFWLKCQAHWQIMIRSWAKRQRLTDVGLEFRRPPQELLIRLKWRFSSVSPPCTIASR